MSLDVKTGVVYGMKMLLNELQVEEIEKVGFSAFPVTYRSDEVDREQDYIFGQLLGQTHNVGQSDCYNTPLMDIEELFWEKFEKLSFEVKGQPAILVTSYYW